MCSAEASDIVYKGRQARRDQSLSTSRKGLQNCSHHVATPPLLAAAVRRHPEAENQTLFTLRTMEQLRNTYRLSIASEDHGMCLPLRLLDVEGGVYSGVLHSCSVPWRHT